MTIWYRLRSNEVLGTSLGKDLRDLDSQWKDPFVSDYARLKIALTRIEGAQWRLFERLATVFVAEEYPSLRPTAQASGDDGMDATLFQPTDDPDVILQFSIRKDWSNKIKDTCRRLKTTAPTTRVLVYATNQEVGAAANGLKRELRKDFGLHVDIRDREWFLTNRNHTIANRAEADEFCRTVADPFVSEEVSFGHQAEALEDLEAKAAFVYLGLQWEDDTREKGLTKLCYEALVRAVLRETTSESRMSRAAVKHSVARLLPAQHSVSRDARVDSALRKLTKVHIRHWTKQDEFCLTWDERVRLKSRLSEMEELDAALRNHLRRMLARFFEEEAIQASDALLDNTVNLARSTIERILLDRGEAFAEAVVSDAGADLRFEDVEAVVYSDLNKYSTTEISEPRHVAALVQSALVEPPEGVRAYLRSLSDTYTLFAFMRETPDVQSAVVKIFSEGDIWLDTSVVLPALAEELLESEPDKSHTVMLRAAREAGLNLFVTEGVVEEIYSHIHRSLGYYRALGRGEAVGLEPFLLSCYRLNGREMARFEEWMDTFCGTSRPADDLADYLHETLGIILQNLDGDLQQADSTLRIMVGEIWHESRDERDRRQVAAGGTPLDMGTRHKLVSHDVENYLGVQMRRLRRHERRSAFGYKSWWLTLDGTAFRVHKELAKRLDGRIEPSPAISPDFMLHYLAVGPVRARLARKTEEVLPLMLNMSILDAVPKDLIELSDTLRLELTGRPPHVIRRKIRDTLDQARYLLGAAARAGEQGLNDEIKRKLLTDAKAK